MTVVVSDAAVVFGTVRLLAPISLAAAPGEAVALRGANGAGKTTLLRAIGGSVRLESGSITIAGDPVAARSPVRRRRVAALIGMPPFARDLTLAEHLALIAASWGRADDSAALLHGLRLGDLATRFPHELSSGQTQLFSLAIVLARPSAVLVVFAPGALIGGAGVLGASLVPVVLGLRLIAATEPPMDPAVLAPIPSPYGDLSGLRVFFWLTGTATLSVIAGGLAAWIPIPGGALLVGAVTTALIVAVILHRLRRDTTA